MWTVLVLAFIVCVVGCADETTAVLTDEPGTVEVEAPAGRCWSGAFGDRTVEGCGPRSVEIKESIIVANAQKQTPGKWKLRLTLTVGDEVKDESETTAEFGIAQVSEGR